MEPFGVKTFGTKISRFLLLDRNGEVAHQAVLGGMALVSD
jgi:hypothetical protein